MRALLLGPLEVLDDAGAPVTVPGAKQRRLLALLAVHAGEVVSADRIVDVLWGEKSPRDPANAVQAKIAQLRRLLEPRPAGATARVLVRRAPGYLLDLAADDVDATVFARLAGQGREALAAGDPAAAADRFRAALSLWRGPPLAEFAGEEFAAAAVARWEEERAVVLEDRIEADLALDGATGLVPELQALVAAHPTRERLRALLVRALYAAGRQADALAAFHHARRFLDEELGVSPGPQLRAAFEAVLHHDPALTSTSSARPRPAAPRVPPAARLPAPLTTIVGRAEEVDAVGALLAGSRLVTLTGPGGVGKSRLALEVAHRIGGDGDGPWWVDLSVVGSPAELVREIAAALGLADERAVGGGTADPRARLVSALAERPVLLVWDDAEHLVAAVAELAGELLAAAPGLRLLVTSREPLGLPGEQMRSVAPLGCPPDGAGDADALRRSPAVELFLDRVTAAAPGFALDEATAPAVATVCRELDGLPLALELAAAKVRTLGVTELARRLDDRFRLLASRTGVPRRRQTLLAVVRWSWDLLEDAERTLLARLSVLGGRWRLAAAERVGADARPDLGRTDEVAGEPVADLLARLVDKSLVVVEASTDGAPRYRLLETVRRFAADRLAERGEQDEARAALVSYVGELAAPATTALRGADQLETARRLDEERANIRAALTWSADAGDRAPFIRLVTDLCWYWYLTGQPEEALRWLRPAAAAARSDPGPENALATLWAAFLGAAAEGPAASWPRIADLLPPLDGGTAEQRVIGGCLAVVLARGAGDAEAAERISTATRWVAVAADDRHGLATLDYLDALPPAQRGDLATAGDLLAEALDRFAEAGDRWGQVQSLNGLYTVAEAAGDLERAGGILERALPLAGELGVREMQAVLLTRAASLALRRGDAAEAAAAAEQARSTAAEVGSALVTAMAEHTAGLAARGLGRLSAAATAQEAALAVYRRAGVATGAAATLRELGTVARLTGDVERARRLHRGALQHARAGGDPRLVASVLEAIAVGAAAGLPATGTDGEGTGEHTSAARQVLRVLAAARALRGGGPPDDPADVEDATARARIMLGNPTGEPAAPEAPAVERLLDELTAATDHGPGQDADTAEPGRSH
ncbi:AfsR/SARP family transcriptional regulator [Blastococcus sp. MG754426]|uniref:AfsR/SARP family transcriptional regulator n=1 Tax=unclassified Blastococcus TaxID=2619396 RepID=UPI001EEF78A0|nr:MULTISPECIES: BTAD domain-containing putative transcriptional regulator [unclassified Blastococcus]MCF6506614.1 AfsR/SARP family transcriptional regulator [Blastococcus sp. MG754426]MCF6510326.1 AfsR/SARP family transcriptional regulator [Blastococcus sp. MG754427]